MNTAVIWKEFNHQLLAFVKAHVSNPEIAEDILQDVFVKIHQRSDQLIDSDKLGSWVYQITRNSIIDFYRKKKLPSSDLEVVEQTWDETESNLNPQFVKCLMPFIRKLPEKYQDALNKTVYGDLSQKE
ncbi:MAG: sigma-70 family RNA polymerase sigma factor [Crocinitomicaceae bacterium]